MKKKILIAAVAIAAAAAPAFAVAFNSHRHEQGVNNIVCSLCKGNGLSNNGRGPFRCPWCKGSGFQGSY